MELMEEVKYKNGNTPSLKTAEAELNK